MRSVITWFIDNTVAANLLMFILIISGLMALPMIHQEEFPNIDPDMIAVGVRYNGASPIEMEQTVCVRIEESIVGIDGIDKVTSTVSEGYCQVMVQLFADTDKVKALNDIKTKVDAIDSFPVDADRPITQQVTILTHVLQIAVFGHADERTLKEVGENIRSDLLAFNQVSQVFVSYVRPYEISIEVSEQNLRRYGLTLDQVAKAIAKGSLDLPGGSIKTEVGEISVRTIGQANTVADFEKISILTFADGTSLPLGDIAEVIDGFEDGDLRAYYDGKPAIVVEVKRIGNEDILEIADVVKQYVDEAETHIPEGLALSIWKDESQDLVERLDVLSDNAISGLLLVFLVLALFLRFSLAIWVAAGIPIALLGTVATFVPLGISISTLTVMAFILVLGVLVDDAIVIGERVYYHQEQGLSPRDAAVKGSGEVSIPVIFGVLTTMATFIPIMYLPGTMGSFFAGIGATAIIALAFSLIESQLILPAHLSHRAKNEKPAGRWQRFQDRFAAWLGQFSREVYRPFLLKVLSWRYAAVAVAFAVVIIIVSLVASSRIIFYFFPPVDGNRLYATLTMPEGTPVELTAKAAEQIQQGAVALGKELDSQRLPGEDSMVKHTMVSIGSKLARGSIDGGGNAGSQFAEVSVQLDIPMDYTGTTPSEMVSRWRELTGPVADAVELVYTAAAFSAGKAIDIQLSSDSLDELKEAAAMLRQTLAAYPAVYDISDTFRSGKQEVELRLLDNARNLDLTVEDLATQVQSAFYGREVQRIQRGRDDVKVMVRYPEAERRSLADLEMMRIRTKDGIEVPFSSVAEIKLGDGFSSIQREEGLRIIHVQAEIDRTVSSPEQVLSALEDGVFGDIQHKFPDMKAGLAGEAEERADTMAGLIRLVALALIVVFTLLAIPLKSYLQPLLIMAIIPFGAMGAVLGHYVFGKPLVFFSTLGIVALSGVVVNACLILVDCINQKRRDGVDLMTAVSTAGVERFRPIILTSTTTFVGLIPLILTDSLATGLFVPMAISLSFGILFATPLTLLLLPCLYVLLEDAKSLVGKLRGGRESVGWKH
ncbi:Multidrug resistance protein MdtC [Sinobacterium norvegicum]|uniref:Multidrug resistance protein MdtC n=1 Tax=Sinobacterium norvegicum TaxID=1641715 RepID=A0ABM9AH65_9GAMM|nr:efflux RND transporter permease subunit [Sinobacterium norvegicum]CAH0992383.1 Multidrug resistance protein MdtC [Sinobacterium norvegicum]